MISFRHKCFSVALLAPLALLIAAQSSAWASAPAEGKSTASVASTGSFNPVAARVIQKINENDLQTLTGHVRPFIEAATDLGPADDSLQTSPIMLLLSRTPQQQADLDALVDQLHNKKSANYKKWLTPAEFGARFQPADSDVAAVKSWLESKGFTVLDVVPSKTFISFKGTVGQLRDAFHVEMHKVTINGENHVAAVTEPQVPAALAPVIAGLNKLDDFAPKPLVKQFGAFKRDLRTGKVTRVEGSVTKPTANFTFCDTADSPCVEDYELGPQDFYTVYNENPLLSSGITGAGQTIAVIEEVQVATADVNTFRTFWGLPTYPASPNATGGGVNYLLGTTSGLSGYASCLTPVSQASGKTSGEESEADIDLQWAGTVAPNAIIDFVACGGTNGGDGSAPGAYGTDQSAQYIVNYLSSTVVAASMSYGECEGDLTQTNMNYYNGQWEQFAAEGITPIISSGDGGAEQCYQNSTHATTLAPSVNGFGDSAYNVSAGGTDFGDLYISDGYTTSPASTWWNSTNGTGYGSAVGYVPETTWAGYCSGELFASYLQKAGSTTFGTNYNPGAICSKSTGSLRSYLEVVGGAGGVSVYNTIPTWQSVYGVGQNSVSTTYRNIPDVSLFASNGWWGHFLPYCESDAYACTLSDYDAGDMGAGGTSFVAPQLAGLMALINQKTGARQGQADYTFYNLANQEYGSISTAAASLTACSGSAVTTSTAPPSSCYFYDISNDTPSLQGGTITAGNYQPCTAADLDCYKGTGATTYGVNVVPGTTATAGILGYTASPGYDDVTGLGSLNINGIVNGWNNASPAFASTTTLAAPTTFVTPTTSVNLAASVVANGRGSTVSPAGVVGFYVGSTSGTSLGTAPVVSSCTGTGSAVSCTGTATLSLSGAGLTPGTDSVIAYFEGDGANDGPSTSSAKTLKVYGTPVGNLETAIDASTGSTTVASTDSIYINGWAADPTDGSPVTSVIVYIDGVSIGAPTLGVSRPDVASYYNNPAYTNSGFTLYYPASGLSAGSHTITAVETNGGGVKTTLGPLSITVNVVVVYPAPIGNLETAEDASTLSTTVQSTDNLYVSGWIADPTDGSPMSNVHVLVDGVSVGTPTLGISRPDVASYYNNPAYTNSGFTFTYAASQLSPGSHAITVVGTNSHGVSTTFGPLTISVVHVNVPPVGNLETAADSATLQPSISQSSGTLYINGWAADYQSNSGVASVSILVDGAAFGTATTGISRPDVAAYYNDPGWTNSGFDLYSSVSALSQGTHQVTAVATDLLGLQTTLGPLTITITP